MENKTAKISAQQLYNVVLDTNAKITELEKIKVKIEKTSLPFGFRLSLLLMVFGAALVVSILFPVCKSFFGLALDTATWNCVYLAYAALTLVVAFLANINRAMRFSTTIMAIAPLVVSVLTTL